MVHTASVRPRLIKLSGEALGSETGPFAVITIDRICAELVAGSRGAEPVAVVVGGGNILRGAGRTTQAADPTRGDYMGMLATLMNSLALQEGIERAGGRSVVMAPHGLPNVAETYLRPRALELLASGTILIFGGGTGHPFFTTDTTAALRAAEIGAGLLLKGSKVDGIYSADPKRDLSARRFERLTFPQAIEGRYAVMDLAAFEICRDRGIDIRVFDMPTPGAIAASPGVPTARNPRHRQLGAFHGLRCRPRRRQDQAGEGHRLAAA